MKTLTGYLAKASKTSSGENRGIITMHAPVLNAAFITFV